MIEQNRKIAVLFGGSGFIGCYLALAFIESRKYQEIILADLKVPDFKFYPKEFKQFFDQGLIKFVQIDVIQFIKADLLPSQVDLIVNLAAVHREPGHESFQYYSTNLPGAEQICQWASQVKCQRIIFTSSIAVYGSAESDSVQSKTEQTVPQPNTPYGLSKLAAERIHLDWQTQNSDNYLLIVRPGVIFGSGEFGNVTRMVRAVIGNYFFYTGNHQTRKAGGYVKELCRSIVWMLDKQAEQKQNYLLYNFTMDPAPTVEEFVTEISRVSGITPTTKNLPFKLLLFGSFFTHWLSRLFGRTSNINPTRVRKLLRSNYIEAEQLKSFGYQYQYDLRSAMADWKDQNPEDWR